MKRTRRAILSLALAGSLLSLSGSTAGEERPRDPAAEIAEEMRAWMELAAPGPHHAHLDRFVGSWAGEITMWMMPGAEPATYQSTAEARWILGGRYLEWSHTGLFDGSPFEGAGVDGYNNGADRYESTWIDNFGTLTLYYVGSCADGGEVRTLETSFDDPIGDGEIRQRVHYRWTDEDHFTYESFMSREGVEYRNMLIEYERR